MAKSATKQLDVIQHFRLSHHAIAQMFAGGMEKEEVHRRTGFSPRRLSILYADPTFQSLISHYANAAAEARQEMIFDYQQTSDNNALMAARMITEKLEEADTTGQLPSYAQLLAITNSRDKRHGSAAAAKGGLTVNIGIALDAAKNRAREAATPSVTIEHIPTERLTDTGLTRKSPGIVYGPDKSGDLKKLRI